MAGFDFTVTDSGGLEALAARLQALGAGEWKPDFYERSGRACNVLVGKEFQEGKDPFGAPWMPTKRGNSPLIGPTRELSTSNKYYPTSTGFILSVADPKANFHQRGTFVGGKRHIWPRPMLPIGTDMPPSWREEIRHEFRVTLTKAMNQ